MITIQRLEDTIKFTFDNNPLYLHDGTIEVPVNSLSLLIDESDIATFLKADSNDIFLSCSLDELGMAKEELLTWYKENATDAGMSPEEVEEIVEEATENLFGYAEYDSQSTRINFKHDASGDVITYIDATDFVIDGMIDNVEIVEVQGVKYLKITFNTESGKEPILIPLSDIFDPDEYYTKTEVDNAISAATSGKVSVDVFEEKERVIAASLVDLDERKLDASAYTPTDLSNYYTKSETDDEISAAVSGKADTSAVTEAISAAVSGKADTSAVTEAISAAVSGKADSSAVTQEISAAVSGKADSDSVYTKTETDTLLADKADSSAVTQEISAAVSGKADSSAVTQEISAAVSGKADSSAVTEAISAAVSGKADSSAVTQEISAAVSGKADSSAVTEAISAAVSGKADSSAVTQEISAAVSGKADSSAVTQEISAAVSGKVDTTDFNSYSGAVDSRLAEDEEVTAAGLNALNDKFGGLKFVKLTQAEYDALTVKDNSTLYVII